MLLLKGHRNAVKAIAFSPDNGSLASAGQDARVRLWDLSTGKMRRVLEGQTRTVNAVAFASDGQTVAAGGWDTTLQVWETVTGRVIAKLPALPEGARDPSPYTVICAVCFAPDGTDIITAGFGGLKCWKWSGQGYKLIWHQPGWAIGVACSPNGRLLATAGLNGDGVRIWQIKGSVERMNFATATSLIGDSTHTLTFAPDSRTLAGACGTSVRVWDVAEGRELFTAKGSRKNFQSVAFSPDGTLLAAANNDGTVRVWQTSSWKELTCFEWEIGKALCVAFSPDGMRAAVGGRSGKIIVWNIDRNLEPW